MVVRARRATLHAVNLFADRAFAVKGTREDEYLPLPAALAFLAGLRADAVGSVAAVHAYSDDMAKSSHELSYVVSGSIMPANQL